MVVVGRHPRGACQPDGPAPVAGGLPLGSPAERDARVPDRVGAGAGPVPRPPTHPGVGYAADGGAPGGGGRGPAGGLRATRVGGPVVGPVVRPSAGVHDVGGRAGRHLREPALLRDHRRGRPPQRRSPLRGRRPYPRRHSLHRAPEGHVAGDPGGAGCRERPGLGSGPG